MLRPQDHADIVCHELLEYLQLALNDKGRDVSSAFVAAGSIAWDDCCGTLVVAPERIYRTESFPTEFTSIEQCWGGYVVMNVVVLLVRCVPTVDDQGHAPSPQEQDDAYRPILDDAATLWEALEGALPHGWLRAGLAQQFSGDAGGCIGVETRVTLGLDQDEID